MEAACEDDDDHHDDKTAAATTTAITTSYRFGEEEICLALIQETEEEKEGLALPSRSTGVKVWPSALLLCHVLNDDPALVRAKSVLELGAGLGLCGLFSAKLGATKTVITDNDDQILSALQQNIALNFGKVSLLYSFRGLASHESQRSGVTCCKLRWGHQQQLGVSSYFPSKFDVILASDVLYYPSAVEPFWQTVDKLLAKSSTTHTNRPKLILSHVSREKAVDSLLMECAHRYGFIAQPLYVHSFLSPSPSSAPSASSTLVVSHCNEQHAMGQPQRVWLASLVLLALVFLAASKGFNGVVRQKVSQRSGSACPDGLDACALFEGGGIEVSAFAGYSFGSAFALSFWYKRTAGHDGYAPLLNQGYAQSSSFDIRLGRSSEPKAGHVFFNTAPKHQERLDWKIPPYSASNPQWSHIVLNFDSPQVSLHVNSSAVALTTAEGSMAVHSPPLRIGFNDYFERLHGLMANIQFFERALSAQEIAQLWQNPEKTIDNGLLARYSFEKADDLGHDSS
ncbi:Calmodulin-lysine N-methyltransferase [Balamuthia mandrillaris]